MWCAEITALDVSFLLEFGVWVLWMRALVLLLALSELYRLLALKLALFIIVLCVLT